MTENSPDHEIPSIIIVKRRRHVEEHPHSTAWKIALADFMTTLMIVFFVMWIVNIMPPSKKLELVSFFQGKADEKTTTSNAGVLPQKVIQKNEMTSEQKIYYALEPELKKLDPSLKIYLSRGRLEINLNSNVLFDPGKANIKSAFKKIIYKISELVRNKDVYVDVYGYADNTPIAGGTNLILSATRAQDAAKEFINQGIPDGRMGVHGEGDRFPVAKNDTEAGRSLNRRIVIYISPMNPPKDTSADAAAKAPDKKGEKNEATGENTTNNQRVINTSATDATTHAAGIEEVKNTANNTNASASTNLTMNLKSSI